MKDETKIVIAGRDPARQQGAVNPPVYHVSTVVFPTIEALDAAHASFEDDKEPFVYGRTGTPTSHALENAVAWLEGGYRARIFPSGLAAAAGALLAFLKAGDHLLVTDSVYAPTRTFCDAVLARYGVAVEYYDPCIGAGIAKHMRANTKVVFAESPGSLTFEVQDIPAIAEVARGKRARVIMDNTWATPLFFKSFAHGVDVSIQAATKYIAGHSDAMLGLAIANRESWPELRRSVRQMGWATGPDDIYLTQRGLRTLAVRLERHQTSALALAEWLSRRPEVARVLYPALPGDPGHALWRRDFLGAAGLFAFELKPHPDRAVRAMIESLRLFHIGYSWGGYESLVTLARPEKARSFAKWEGGPLVRLHVGLEAVEDLQADLEGALLTLKGAS
jgi:cystathionine beta-lyase